MADEHGNPDGSNWNAFKFWAVVAICLTICYAISSCTELAKVRPGPVFEFNPTPNRTP